MIGKKVVTVMCALSEKGLNLRRGSGRGSDGMI